MMVEVICETEVGQQCQITNFFWMTHSAIVLIVVCSQQEGIGTITVDFFTFSLTLDLNSNYPKYCLDGVCLISSPKSVHPLFSPPKSSGSSSD